MNALFCMPNNKHVDLAPMVAPFFRAYAGIALDIVSDRSLVEIVAAGSDAGVRHGEHGEFEKAGRVVDGAAGG